MSIGRIEATTVKHKAAARRGGLANSVAGAIAIGMLGLGPAAADGLFKLATASEVSAAQGTHSSQSQASPEPNVRRKGVVAIDPYYLRSRIAPDGTEKLSDNDRDALVARLPTDLELTLFPDVVLRLRRSGDKEGRSDGPTSFFWAGAAQNGRVCDAFISIERGELFGEIVCADSGKEYRISHITGNLYEVVEMETVPDFPDTEFLDEPTSDTTPELEPVAPMVAPGGP